MALGALGVSASSIFIGLSGTSPGTATFFRCVLALPLLWTQAIYEIGAGLPTVLVNAQVIIVQQPQRAGPSSRLWR